MANAGFIAISLVVGLAVAPRADVGRLQVLAIAGALIGIQFVISLAYSKRFPVAFACCTMIAAFLLGLARGLRVPDRG